MRRRQVGNASWSKCFAERLVGRFEFPEGSGDKPLLGRGADTENVKEMSSGAFVSGYYLSGPLWGVVFLTGAATAASVGGCTETEGGGGAVGEKAVELTGRTVLRDRLRRKRSSFTHFW